MGWFRSDKEEDWLEQQRAEERERIREREMEEDLIKDRKIKKQNALAGLLVGIGCIVALGITCRVLLRDNRAAGGNEHTILTAEEGAVLSSSWKGILDNGSVIQTDQIEKIVFIDLADESDLPENDMIGEMCYPKDMDESAADSGEVYMWAEDVDGQFVLYIGAKGGVWAPEDCSKLFSDCEELEEIVFDGAFHTENATDMKAMFFQCSSLASLDVSCFETGNVTDMGWMFSQCSSLIDLDVSGFETGNVTDMRYMFADCSGLPELDVHGFDTSCVESMKGMFAGCWNLTELDLSGFDTENLRFQGMDGIFSECNKLESAGNISVPEGSEPYAMNIFEIMEREMPPYE